MARDRYLQLRLTSEEQELIRKAFRNEASTIARNYLLERAIEKLSEEELEEIEGFAEMKATACGNIKELYLYKLGLGV